MRIRIIADSISQSVRISDIRVRALFIVAVSLLLSITPVQEQARAQGSYPLKTIRLIVPFPAGGVNDVIARAWAEGVSSVLGRVVIENKGGGGGTIGATEVARALPDGYTLLLGNTSTQVVSPLLMQPQPYDVNTSFDAASILTVVPNAFAVHSGVEAKTLQDLISFAKQNPGRLSYGSAGTGSLTHIAAEMLKQMSGVEIIHVPYRGVAPGLTDLVGGHIPMFSASMSSQLLELHKAKKIRILAVNSLHRLEMAPDIPTAAEAGFPRLVATSFNGIFGPAGTPRHILDQIAAATQKALAILATKEALERTGGVLVRGSNPDSAREMVETERRRWLPILEALRGKI